LGLTLVVIPGRACACKRACEGKGTQVVGSGVALKVRSGGIVPDHRHSPNVMTWVPFPFSRFAASGRG